MKKLIINADDFGKFSKVNAGIIEGIQANIITSTSLLVFGKYAQEAKKLLEFSNVSIGLHYEKRFENEEKMVKDFDTQLEIFTNILGRQPDHIDFHKLHGLENYPILDKHITEYIKRNNIPGRRMGYAHYIGDFFAMDKIDYKTIDLEKVSTRSLINVLDSSMVEGLNELMCHAGRVDKEVEEGSSYWSAREVELDSLLSNEFKEYLQEKDIKLVSWKDLQKVDSTL